MLYLVPICLSDADLCLFVMPDSRIQASKIIDYINRKKIEARVLQL